MIIAILAFLIFLLIWFLPPFRKQGKAGKPAAKWYVLPTLTTAIIGFAVILGLQLLLMLFTNAVFTPGSAALAFFNAFISAALIEESGKGLTGWLFTKRSGAARKIDYMFIFGAAGLGFELSESLLKLDDVVSGIFTGVMCLHVFWQIYMGAHIYEYRAAKAAGDAKKAKTELCKALLVPYLLHALNDLLAFLAEMLMAAMGGMEAIEQNDALGIPVLLLYAVVFGIGIVFCVITRVQLGREAKRSALAEVKEQTAEQKTV